MSAQSTFSRISRRGLTTGAPYGLLPDDLQVRKVLRGVISL